MKSLLSKIAGPLAILTLTSTLALAKDGWGEDYAKGLADAKAGKKIALLDFTGSDWCGWCIKLDKEVFSQAEFIDYAKKNLVLIELDFPNKKKQSDELKAQNQKLQKEYKIEGYPTVIVLNSEGKKIGELGYQEGGPKAFIAALEKLKK